jgi:porin
VAAQEATLERQYLTGDWRGIRPALSAHGFEPYLVYTGTMWSNLAGGRTTGVRWNGYLDMGLEVELAKLGTWDGLGFHFDAHWWQGTRLSQELIGGLAAMSPSDWEASATLRIYNIYLRQSLYDDRVVLKAGQLAADTDFMVTKYGGIFLNAAFGALPSQDVNLDTPVYPLAAPGVVVLAKPRPWLTGRFGAYTGDAGDDVAGNHGFGWGLGNNAGYTFYTELAATVPGASLPGTYTLGGIFDTGGSAQFGTGEERRAHYELYLMVDQALVARDNGDPMLGAFARISGSPQDDRNVVGLYADAGLAVFGLLPSRSKDVLGVAVSVLRFTDDFQRIEQTAGTPVGRGETALEVTYQITLAPWLVVQPDAQFFFDPPFSRRDAKALGVEVVIVF